MILPRDVEPHWTKGFLFFLCLRFDTNNKDDDHIINLFNSLSLSLYIYEFGVKEMGRMLGEMRPIDNEDDGAQPKISHNIYINGIMQIINIPFVVYFPLRPVYNINKRIWKHIQQNKTQTKDIISILNDVYNAREITQLYYYVRL